MAPAGVNDPSSYYALEESPSLAWEMTICQSLSDRGSPYLQALETPRLYGDILASFLRTRWATEPSSVVEVGGGQGTLMASLLDALPFENVTMVDVSPFFLRRQRQALSGRKGVSFRLEHAFAFLDRLSEPVDLLISNENLGDLRTITGVERLQVEQALAGSPADPLAAAVAEKIRAYGLDFSGAPEAFHFSIGAVEYLERLAPKARAVFLTEHGADTVVPPPYDEFVGSEADGFPRQIRLRGHDEYSIRFGDLAAVGRALGYRVERLHMMEFLGLRHDPAARSMVRVHNTRAETAELVRELFLHAAEYQVLYLWR